MNLIDLAVALAAGLISITSPCCLPLLPGYLGYLTGMSTTELGRSRRRPVAAALLFVAGFTAVFATLGATASALGVALLLHRRGLEQVAGGFILVIGLLILLSYRIGWLNRGGDWSRRWAKGQLWTAAPLGAAFAITWTPCI
ncbi:MAG: cytochrome c biogenesis CcdA family protein, partial [Candidatus Dormibacteria bacterium]